MDNKFEQLSLREITQFIKSSAQDANLPANELMMIYQRLMDIALMDHGIPDCDRSVAEQLAESIKQAVISSDLSADGKSSFESAIAAHKAYITRFGRGTVIWDMEEPKLQRQQTSTGVPPELQDQLDKKAKSKDYADLLKVSGEKDNREWDFRDIQQWD